MGGEQEACNRVASQQCAKCVYQNISNDEVTPDNVFATYHHELPGEWFPLLWEVGLMSFFVCFFSSFSS